MICAVNELSPSVIILQETKLKKSGMIKTLKGYQIFEKIRKHKCGGGLLVAVENNLNPVLVDNDESVELLIVEINLPVGKAHIINGYGPQEHDLLENKLSFWQRFEDAVTRAKESECMIISQMGEII